MRRKAGTSAGANESQAAPNDATIVLRVRNGSSDHLAVELERGEEMHLWIGSSRKIDVFLYTEADYDGAAKGIDGSPGEALHHYRATTSTGLTFRTSKRSWFYLVFVCLGRGALIKIALTIIPGPPRKRSIAKQCVQVVPRRPGVSERPLAQRAG